MFKFVLAILLIAAISAEKFTDFKVKDLDGNVVDFKKYKSQCVLVVNTASKGFLSVENMKYLNKLSEKHPSLKIVAFPSDVFGQEKKNNSELKEWFKTWKATYDVLEKTDAHTADVYKFLIKQAGDRKVIWNYGKYLVEKDGTTVEMFGPQAGAIFWSSLDRKMKKCVEST